MISSKSHILSLSPRNPLHLNLLKPIQIVVCNLEQAIVFAHATSYRLSGLFLVVLNRQVQTRMREQENKRLAACRLLCRQMQTRLSTICANVDIGIGLFEQVVNHAVRVPVAGRVQRGPAHVGASLELFERRHVDVVLEGDQVFDHVELTRVGGSMQRLIFNMHYLND